MCLFFCVCALPLPSPPTLKMSVKMLESLSSLPGTNLTLLSFDALFTFPASVLCIALQLVPGEWRILFSSHFGTNCSQVPFGSIHRVKVYVEVFSA